MQGQSVTSPANETVRIEIDVSLVRAVIDGGRHRYRNRGTRGSKVVRIEDLDLAVTGVATRRRIIKYEDLAEHGVNQGWSLRDRRPSLVHRSEESSGLGIVYLAVVAVEFAANQL